ncbi:MAG: metallophosphoesterase [Paracoccaceae bacterium]
MRAYAIGDIHGHIDLLELAHERIARDRGRTGDETAPVVHIGDLVDRGPDSAGVIDWLIEGIDIGLPWVVIKGNHDRLFQKFLEDPQWQDDGLRAELSWLHPKLGGGATLASYGVENAADRPVGPVHAEALQAVPPEHRAFVAGLPTSFQHGEALFVHAGIRPGVVLPDQRETDLVWIREPFLSDTRDHGRLVVHGHTAIDAATHYSNRLNIDSGAAYGRPLTAVVIEGRDAWELTDTGRVPVVLAE